MPPHNHNGGHGSGHGGGGFASHHGGFGPQGNHHLNHHHNHQNTLPHHHHHHHNHRHFGYSHWHHRRHLGDRIAIHRSHHNNHGCFCGCISLIFVFISWLMWDVILGLICCLFCCTCSTPKEENDTVLKEGLVGSSPQVVVGIPIPVIPQQAVYQIGVTPTGQPIYSQQGFIPGGVVMGQVQQQGQYHQGMMPSAPPPSTNYYPPPQVI